MAIAAAWNVRFGGISPANLKSAPGLTTKSSSFIGLRGTKGDDRVDATTRTPDYVREPEIVETTIKASRDSRSAGFSAAGSLARLSQTDKNGRSRRRPVIPNWKVDVAVGRIAPLLGSAREGPGSGQKPAFR
jgi:hypothetical protein